MGTFSTWIENITDPSEVDPEVMLALQALVVVIDELYQADYIEFTYDVFFSGVTKVGEALRQLADAMIAEARQVITIPSFGAVLVDATMVAQVVVHRAGTPGIGQVYLDVGASGTAGCTIQLMKNGSSMYQMTFIPGEKGPVEVDLSFFDVVIGDVLGIYCVIADGAEGLMATLEI
jgi:hypothetical protein